MMEFLRGLAPHHANDATSAVAALPSRFELEQPLRVASPRTQALEVLHDSESREEPRVAAPLSSLGPGRGQPHCATQEPAAMAPEDHPTAVAVRPPAVAPSRSAESGDAAPAPPATWISGIAARRADVGGPESPRRRPQPQPEGPELGPRAFPSRAETHPQAPMPTARAPMIAPAAAAPLSRRTVEAHAELRVGRRPIVHVTIDRIDVSAPACAPDRPKPPARSRRSSGQSLTDYLRARHPGQQGDAS